MGKHSVIAARLFSSVLRNRSVLFQWCVCVCVCVLFFSGEKYSRRGESAQGLYAVRPVGSHLAEWCFRTTEESRLTLVSFLSGGLHVQVHRAGRTASECVSVGLDELGAVALRERAGFLCRFHGDCFGR